MYFNKYQALVKVTLLYAGLLISTGAFASKILDLEESNLIGPKNFIASKPQKFEWEDSKPQGSIQKNETSLVYYFNKHYPELQEQASKNLSKKIPLYQWEEEYSYDKGSSWD